MIAVAEADGGVAYDLAILGQELVGRRRGMAFLRVEPDPVTEVGVDLGDTAGERVQVGIVGESKAGMETRQTGLSLIPTG